MPPACSSVHGHRGGAGVRAHARRVGRPGRRCCWATRPPPTDIARVQKDYGLDKPLPVQFGYWLREVLHGNLGESIFLQRPVTQALWERAEPTALLSLLAVSIAALIGVPCGIVSAVYRGRDGRPGVHRLRDARRQRAELLARAGADADLRSVARLVSGRRVTASRALRWQRASAAWCCRPRCSGLLNSALIIRFTRASMLDVLGEDYVRTARAKGLSERRRGAQARAAQRAGADRHRARPRRSALMIGGAVVTETVFGLPGFKPRSPPLGGSAITTWICGDAP